MRECVYSCVLACVHVLVHVCYCMHVVMKCWRKHGYWWVSVGMHVSCMCKLVSVCMHVNVFVLEH